MRVQSAHSMAVWDFAATSSDADLTRPWCTLTYKESQEVVLRSACARPVNVGQGYGRVRVA